jgi:UDP-N-acetylglucosamine--N-acetylmuramyl-(pentapeptide) pyrophosphoryl-undecaprenol N-acetylglucosamine transferase
MTKVCLMPLSPHADIDTPQDPYSPPKVGGMAQQIRVVLAAGGTGGHLFPAQALADALSQEGALPILFTDTRTAHLNMKELQHLCLPMRRQGKGWRHKLLFWLSLAHAYLKALEGLRHLKPQIVVGFGGYPSLPTLLAARTLSIPYMLHEQNAVLGRANRLLAKGAQAIAGAFMPLRHLPNEKIGRKLAGKNVPLVLTGNPVRPAFQTARHIPYPTPHADGALTLLVTGGSQGAQIFGKVVPAALALLAPAWRQRINLTLQCRAEDVSIASAALRPLGINYEVAAFFDDMPTRLANAQLLLCRAGASTIAELTLVGRPAILVPYPHAADNHQYANAEALADAGAAWLMPQSAFTAESLAARLVALLTLPTTLEKVAAIAHAQGVSDAAMRLATIVLRLARGMGLDGLAALPSPLCLTQESSPREEGQKFVRQTTTEAA